MDKETLILRPRNLKTIGLLLISFTLVLGGVILIDESPLISWFCISFFGIGVIVFTLELIPNSNYLKLTKDGFEIRSLYKSNFTKWNDINSFKAGVLKIPVYNVLGTFFNKKKKMVFFDYKETHRKNKITKSLSKSLSGSQAALPDLYGMKADELAKLMNDWKK
jgi:hypothetical protein